MHNTSQVLLERPVTLPVAVNTGPAGAMGVPGPQGNTGATGHAR